MSEISGTAGQIARALPRTRTTAWSKAGVNAETAWRRWATKHRAVAAMLGGLVGVHIASVLGAWFGGFHLYRLARSTCPRRRPPCSLSSEA
jgi:hypothetical protein